jgi:hypothetical protein
MPNASGQLKEEDMPGENSAKFRFTKRQKSLNGVGGTGSLRGMVCGVKL